MYTNIKSVCYTPKTNIMLYVNYISIKKSQTPLSTSCTFIGLYDPSRKKFPPLLTSPIFISPSLLLYKQILRHDIFLILVTYCFTLSLPENHLQLHIQLAFWSFTLTIVFQFWCKTPVLILPLDLQITSMECINYALIRDELLPSQVCCPCQC